MITGSRGANFEQTLSIPYKRQSTEFVAALRYSRYFLFVPSRSNYCGLLGSLTLNYTKDLVLLGTACLVRKAKLSEENPLPLYPASRGPSVFLDKSGRGRDLCQPPRRSLSCCTSTETDESVRFETSFSRFCSVRMCLVRNCRLNTRPRYVPVRS